MALFLFTKAILDGKPITIYNNGNMVRDFTYVDDIIDSMILLLQKPPLPNPSFDTYNPDPSCSWAPYKVFNIGNSKPTPLMDYINALESALGITAQKQYLPMQPGDVPFTSADTSSLYEWCNFKPNTSVLNGVSQFVEWYRDFYNL